MGLFSQTPQRVYLDWNATAPLLPAARDAWMQAAETAWANANSLHAEGKAAGRVLEEARERIAALTGGAAGEWIFTSGGTESIHAALYGCVSARGARRRIVSSQGEHASTRAILDDLQSRGFEVVRVGLSAEGHWDPDEVLAASDPACTAMVSLIWAHNETGAISDVGSVAARLRERKIPLHLDAVQVPGRSPFDLSLLPAALVSVSGHKFGAPKGIGGLFVRRATPWRRWMLGGEQERGRRSGTSNVAGAHAMATALAEAVSTDVAALARRRDAFESRLEATIPGMVRIGGGLRLPQTSLVCFDGVDSAPLLLRLDDRGIAVSSGSACTSGRTDPSPTLLAMGLSAARAHGALRVSFGPATAPRALEHLASVLADEVAALRAG